MFDITRDIQSLTTFRRRSGDFMRLLDNAASGSAVEGIRQGLEDVKQGKVRPAREFFADFEAAHGAKPFHSA
jgi:hypothetical protein